jgi:hypothetical protein
MESADVSCSKRQACPREALWTQPLYDVENRRYVSIAQLRHWAVEGVALVVIYAETGFDVTRVLLA